LTVTTPHKAGIVFGLRFSCDPLQRKMHGLLEFVCKWTISPDGWVFDLNFAFIF
jgi:hypothetical protein